jgi:hypothetical protein
VPDWLELEEPIQDGQRGLVWQFTVRTDRPGPLHTSLRFECDSGVGRCQISLVIRDGHPALGDLALCTPPFGCSTSHESLRTLTRILDALPLRIHCLESPSALGALQPRVLLLHQSGLLQCTSDDVVFVEQLASSGTSVVVLADEFFRGTTSAANRILAPFGLRMKQDGTEEPGITREERSRRVGAWQARYDLAPFNSGAAEVCPHRLTAGVRRVHWFRPCPVECVGPHARPLVHSPTGEGECFAGVSEEKGCVTAVGTSLWALLASVGWPYDNDRFFANLLIGGDAEAFVA